MTAVLLSREGIAVKFQCDSLHCRFPRFCIELEGPLLKGAAIWGVKHVSLRATQDF
jgi:hypothetical protein